MEDKPTGSYEPQSLDEVVGEVLTARNQGKILRQENVNIEIRQYQTRSSDYFLVGAVGFYVGSVTGVIGNYIEKSSNRPYFDLVFGATVLTTPFVVDFLSEKKEDKTAQIILALGYAAGITFAYFVPKI